LIYIKNKKAKKSKRSRVSTDITHHEMRYANAKLLSLHKYTVNLIKKTNSFIVEF